MENKDSDSSLRSQITTLNATSLIYEIRGEQVMLDADLARLYRCTNGTKDINKAVKRNLVRFPSDFYFQLTDEEMEILRFQIGTAKTKSRVNSHVFTEQGVAMLASVLHTDVAEEVSVQIMRSFVEMRKYFADPLNNKILINHENRLLKIEDALDKFSEKPLDKKIMIISKNIDKVLRKKYESQYKNIAFKNNTSFHDRFIIIDGVKLYTCGASFKDLGKKCFAIHEFRDEEYLTRILSLAT